MILKPYTEFEIKHKVEYSKLFEFKQIMMNMGYPMTLYCEGPDSYFSKRNTNNFKRFRRANFPENDKKEITTKVKLKNADDNTIRTEVNLDVTGNTNETIIKTILDDGYEQNFEIIKYCHIHKAPKATYVFYSVQDVTKDENRLEEQSFIEIELEDMPLNMTKEQADSLIDRYEKCLYSLGVKKENRLKNSIWEMYKRF